MDSYEALKARLKDTKGFFKAFWAGTEEDEERLQEETGATIRCILPDEDEEGRCIITGRPTRQKVIIAFAY